MRTQSRPLPAVLLAVLFVFFTGSRLLANFSVRNDTPQPLWVAIGYARDNTWFSSGWYAVAPGQTATLLNGTLNQQYYYLYAYDFNNHEWSGEYVFCTRRGQAFDGLPFVHGCNDPSHDHKGFLRIDTQNRPDHVQALSLGGPTTVAPITPHSGVRPGEETLNPNNSTARTGENNGPQTAKTPQLETKGSCKLMPDLSDVSAQLLERFLDIALPQTLAGHDGIRLDYGALLQFRVKRNGPVVVRTSAKGTRFGALTIDVPIVLTDLRLTEPNQPRPRQLEPMSVLVHSTVELTIVDDRFGTLLTNDYTWDYQPSIPVYDKNVNLFSYARNDLNTVLHGAHQQWLTAIDPLLRNFNANQCTWRNAANNTVLFLNKYSVNELTGQRLQETVRAYVDQQLKAK